MPGDTCWNILLVPLENCPRHRGEVYDEISNLAMKLVLIGLLLSAIATRDVGIVFNESDSREARVPLDDGPVIRISNKLYIIILIVPDIFISQTCFFGEVFFLFLPRPPLRRLYVRGNRIGEGGNLTE